MVTLGAIAGLQAHLSDGGIQDHGGNMTGTRSTPGVKGTVVETETVLGAFKNRDRGASVHPGAHSSPVRVSSQQTAAFPVGAWIEIAVGFAPTPMVFNLRSLCRSGLREWVLGVEPPFQPTGFASSRLRPFISAPAIWR